MHRRDGGLRRRQGRHARRAAHRFGDAPLIPSTWRLDLAQFLPNATAALLAGSASANLPFDGAAVPVLPALVFPVAIDGQGNAAFSAPIPNWGALAGADVYWQAWVGGDPLAAGLGFACSGGLQVRLGY